MNSFSIALLTKEQLDATNDFLNCSKKMGRESVNKILISSDLVLEPGETGMALSSLKEILPNAQFLLSLPEILRPEDHGYLESVRDFLLGQSLFEGVVSGSLEGIGYFAKEKKNGTPIKIYGDHNLYLWNLEAIHAMEEMLDGGCLPLELNTADQKVLLRSGFSFEKMIYGRIPMMLTANCVAKTRDACRAKDPKKRYDEIFLKDRMGKEMPVRLVCRHCFNVIYNSVPLSLHDTKDNYGNDVIFRISLTTEKSAETKAILGFFLNDAGEGLRPPFPEYTTGREKKGAT